MKSVLSGTVTALVVTGLLSGCGYNNNQGATNRPGTGMRNVGYYNDHPGQPNQYNMNEPVSPKKGYNDRYSSKSQQALLIRHRVNQLSGISDAQVLVSKNNVIVGVKSTRPDMSTKDVDQKVRSAVKNVVNNKRIHVVTDPSMVNRIKNVNDRLNTGSAGNEVSSDIKGIINDLGNAAKRPFQNNSK